MSKITSTQADQQLLLDEMNAQNLKAQNTTTSTTKAALSDKSGKTDKTDKDEVQPAEMTAHKKSMEKMTGKEKPAKSDLDVSDPDVDISNTSAADAMSTDTSGKKSSKTSKDAGNAADDDQPQVEAAKVRTMIQNPVIKPAS